jgi:hypothetical protein
VSHDDVHTLHSKRIIFKDSSHFYVVRRIIKSVGEIRYFWEFGCMFG